MRILHVLGRLDRGGAETWLVQTLRHIDRSKYQFDFLVHTEEPGAYDDEVRAMGAQVIPCPSPSNPVKYARNFLRILKEYGPYDCVHSHVRHFSGTVLSLARARAVPLRIAHSHSDTRSIDKASSLGRRIYLSCMGALISANATCGLAVSGKAAHSFFGEKWDEDHRWRICAPGIDLEPFSNSVDHSHLRRTLGISEDAFVVGHVGRFFPAKNHVFIVDIAEYICAAQPKTLFVMVGDGPLRDSIERLVQARGLMSHFIFTGTRSDVPALMQGVMDVFLFPSLFEGLGLAVVEAQAAGLPCFISAAVPHEAAVTAQLVRRFTADASAKEWAEAILSGRQNSASHSANLKDFSIEIATKRLCSVYAGCSELPEHVLGDIRVRGVGAQK